MAKNLDMAFRGIQQAEQQFDRGGFSGTIWPEQAEHFTAAHFEIHIVHGASFRPAPKILEDFGQAADRNDGFSGRFRWLCPWRNLRYIDHNGLTARTSNFRQ